MERVVFRIANDIVQVVSSAYAGIGECREKDEIRQNKGEMGEGGFWPRRSRKRATIPDPWYPWRVLGNTI